MPGTKIREKMIHHLVIRMDDPTRDRILAYQERRFREARVPLSLSLSIRELIDFALDELDSRARANSSERK